MQMKKFAPILITFILAISLTKVSCSANENTWWTDDLDLTTAFATYHSNTSIKVGIIDTGIQINHPDLSNHISSFGWDFYHNDSSLFHYRKLADGSLFSKPTDNDDHGTHIAGIIASSNKGSQGIIGVASNTNVKIVPLKTFGGVWNSTSIDKIVKAIHYAENHGVKIINCSWNFSTDNSKLKNAIKESNMLFVCSAGNSSTNIDQTPSYPASYSFSNVISVAGLNSNDELDLAYSNYGIENVDLAAPGTDIVSTVIGGYDIDSGASMAAPMVTGICAMIASTNPKLYSNQIKQIVLSSVIKQSNLAPYTATSGKANAANAIKKALNYKQKYDKKKPKIKTKISRTTKKVKVKIKVSDSGSSALRLIRYAKGKHSKKYFKKGKKGTRLTKSTLTYKKNTTLTVYALDRAGNASIKILKLKKKTKKS